MVQIQDCSFKRDDSLNSKMQISHLEYVYVTTMVISLRQDDSSFPSLLTILSLKYIHVLIKIVNTLTKFITISEQHCLCDCCINKMLELYQTTNINWKMQDEFCRQLYLGFQFIVCTYGCGSSHKLTKSSRAHVDFTHSLNIYDSRICKHVCWVLRRLGDRRSRTKLFSC